MNRIYQTADGQLIFHDPGPGMIPFLSSMDPGFRVESVPPKNDFIPRFQKQRKPFIRSEKSFLELDLSDLDLDADHNTENGTMYSRLDVLHATGLRLLSDCRLCGHDCGVNRYRKQGLCGLGAKVHQTEPFVHIAEETVINSAIVVNLAGCAMRCCYCINPELLQPQSHPEIDPAAFWPKVAELRTLGVKANSLEFTNPTESIHGILALLFKAPQDFNLPVVMNSHLYGTEMFYRLANEITDVWLSDLRYGNDDCARRLSKVADYMKYARIGLDAMCGSDVRTIVRTLVLPGHVECCLKPALKLLAEYKANIRLSVLEQYVPEHEAHRDPDLRRRPTASEINEVKTLASKLGLRDVGVDNFDFWSNG